MNVDISDRPYSHRYSEDWCVRPVLYPTPKHVPFLTAEQFLAVALKAYYAACNELIPPKGEKWLERLDDGTWSLWSGPENFYDGLRRNLDERVRAIAIKRGCLIRRFYSPSELVELYGGVA
jgi:hypothetical protein